MTCPKCGAECSARDGFCASCGSSLAPKGSKALQTVGSLIKIVLCICVPLLCEGCVMSGYEGAVLAQKYPNLLINASDTPEWAAAYQDALGDVISTALSHSSMVTLIGGLMTLVAVCLILRIRKRNPVKSLGVNRINPLRIPMLLLFGFSLCVLVTGVLSVLPLPATIRENFDTLFDSYLEGDSLFVQVIALAVVTPIFEEMIFRGYAISRLSRSLGKTASVIVSALFFGAMHLAPKLAEGSTQMTFNPGSLVSFGYATLLGLLFGWMYVKYDSLIPTVLCHAGFNAVEFFAIDGRLATVLFLASVPLTLFLGYRILVRYPVFNDVVCSFERMKPRNETEAEIFKKIETLGETDMPLEQRERETLRLRDEWEAVFYPEKPKKKKDNINGEDDSSAEDNKED